jgi:hypothetical protein
MNQKQENNQSRHLAVEKFLDENNAIWTTHVEFTAAKTAYSGKITAIKTTVSLQEKNTTGVTLDKKDAKKQLIDFSRLVADALVAMAVITHNNTLEKSMYFSQSTLGRLSDSKLTETATLIHGTANTNLAALATYGITAPTLTSFLSIIADYNSAVPSPRNAIATKSVLTKNLIALLKEADVILNKVILKLAYQFKSSNPDFYNGIIANAEIIDLGKTTTILRFTILSNSNIPVKDALISIVLSPPLTATSNDAGKGSIKKIPFGKRNITIEKSGFQKLTVTAFNFVKGKSVTKTFTLIPI